MAKSESTTLESIMLDYEMCADVSTVLSPILHWLLSFSVLKFVAVALFICRSWISFYEIYCSGCPNYVLLAHLANTFSLLPSPTTPDKFSLSTCCLLPYGYCITWFCSFVLFWKTCLCENLKLLFDPEFCELKL